MKKLLATLLLSALVVVAVPTDTFAKGGGGGGRSSGGARSSSFKSSASKPSAAKPAAAKPSKPAAPKISTKPSGTTQTKTASAKTVSGKKYAGKGYVVGDGYQPKFRGGYTAPAGSVVYYRQNSLLDYLPLYFIMTHGSHREAIVQTPDGKEEVVKEEGTDGMYIFNWLITILLGAGLIGGVVYLINKATKKNRYV